MPSLDKIFLNWKCKRFISIDAIPIFVIQGFWCIVRILSFSFKKQSVFLLHSLDLHLPNQLLLLLCMQFGRYQICYSPNYKFLFLKQLLSTGCFLIYVSIVTLAAE